MKLFLTHPTTALLLFIDNLNWRNTNMAIEHSKLNEGNAKHAYEYLQLINDAESDLKRVELLKKWGERPPLNMLLQLNFNKNIVFDLPAGPPPYNRDEQTHPDMMSPTAGQIQRLKACLIGSNIKKMIKERTLIQVLEMVPAKDADVIVACKDKALNELYPNVTRELVKTVFPSYSVE
jgi:hypothetical protein